MGTESRELNTKQVNSEYRTIILAISRILVVIGTKGQNERQKGKVAVGRAVKRGWVTKWFIFICLVCPKASQRRFSFSVF